MEINISAGDILNDILSNKYKDQIFIPFNEAMIEGSYHYKLFSNKFIKERANHFKVKENVYKEKLKGFLFFLKNIDKYDKVFLWFGNEPFCKENTKIVLEALKEYNFKGKIVLHIVDEKTGDIICFLNIQ